MVAIQHQGLDTGEQAMIAIHVLPAGLHHADSRVAEVTHDFLQERRLGDEVGVEDGDQLARGLLQTEVERAGFVSMAIRSAQIHGVDAALPQLFDRGARDAFRLVGGVVEHLQLEAVARVIESAGSVEQATHDGGLVVQRQLHGDGRQRAVQNRHRARGAFDPALVAHALKN